MTALAIFGAGRSCVEARIVWSVAFGIVSLSATPTSGAAASTGTTALAKMQRLFAIDPAPFDAIGF